MHAVCLGVGKKLATLWFDKKFSSFPWYLGGKMGEIDELLLQVKPPRGVKRLPRSLKERQHWKGPTIPTHSFLFGSLFFFFFFFLFSAAEYRNWLLLFAPVILENFLPPVYHKHLLFLVGSLHVLLSTQIRTSDLPAVDKNLVIFCQAFEKLYGLRFETINFHLLTHLTECVRLFGPLWTTSCFPFENANGFLVRCISGTNSSMTNMLVSARCLENIRAISKRVTDLTCSLFVKELIGGPHDEMDSMNEKFGPFSFFLFPFHFLFFLSLNCWWLGAVGVGVR